MMKRGNNFKLRLLFAIAMFALILTVAGLIRIAEDLKCQVEELENQDPFSGYVFATVQIYNEQTGLMDTYQGTLDFDHGLYGDFMYEVNGLECVMNGARLIGSVDPSTEEAQENIIAEEGKVKIYTDNDETFTFSGTVVRPLPGSDYAFYMPYAELVEFVNLWEGDTGNEK